jgi:hypothetical protein
MTLIAFGLPNSAPESDFIIGTATLSYFDKSISDIGKQSIFGRSFTTVAYPNTRKN